LLLLGRRDVVFSPTLHAIRLDRDRECNHSAGLQDYFDRLVTAAHFDGWADVEQTTPINDCYGDWPLNQRSFHSRTDLIFHTLIARGIPKNRPQVLRGQ
jgi:hypothetical protein